MLCINAVYAVRYTILKTKKIKPAPFWGGYVMLRRLCALLLHPPGDQAVANKLLKKPRLCGFTWAIQKAIMRLVSSSGTNGMHFEMLFGMVGSSSLFPGRQ